MNVRTHNRFSTSIKFITAISLVFLLALFAMPSAFAGKPGGDNCKPNKHKICPPPEPFPGGEDPNTSGRFENENFFFFNSDDINFVKAGLDFDSGDFVMEGSSPEIFIDSRYLNKLQLKGPPNSTLCRAFEDNAVGLFADSFSYGWVDNCTDGSCAVELRLSFSQGISELTNGESDQLDFVMHATIDDTGNAANPFAEPQDLLLYQTEVSFKKPGTTRTAVQCRWTQGGYGSPEFFSSPQ